MIRMIAAAAVLCLVTGFVCWADAHLEAYLSDMAVELEAAENEAGLEDWDAAAKKLETMDERWAEIRPFALIVLEQCAVTDTEEAIARLSAAADAQDKSGFFAEAASLESCLSELEWGGDLSWNTVL